MDPITYCVSCGERIMGGPALANPQGRDAKCARCLGVKVPPAWAKPKLRRSRRSMVARFLRRSG
jgi:hypothetical protein